MINNMKSGIYCIENLINGKLYIGQSVNLNRRWKTHLCTFKSNKNKSTKLQRAVNKNGIENFVFYVIEFCEERLLDQKEMYWIEKMNTLTNGYNCHTGGHNGKPCEETRKKLSLNNGKPFLGKKGSLNHGAKKVYQYDHYGCFLKEWGSLIECADSFNTKRLSIWRVISGKRKSYKGFIFSYLCSKNIGLVSNKIIYQYDLNNVYLAEWNSMQEAVNNLSNEKASSSNIYNNVIGKIKSAYGYIWKKEKI